jgi:hypothetical protein
VNESLVYDECASSRLFKHLLLEFLIFREDVHHKRIGAERKAQISLPCYSTEIDSLLSNDFDSLVNVVNRDDCEHWSENFSVKQT